MPPKSRLRVYQQLFLVFRILSYNRLMHLRNCSVVGIGGYAPKHILTNADLEKLVHTTDAWIQARTGIQERHIANGEVTSEMAAHAARKALEGASVHPSDVDLIIVATATPDMPFPATACFVQNILGAHKAAAFDLAAACSGFLYAVETGRNFVSSGSINTALVIGAEKLSTIVDWTDRETCVLLGDGAGAAVLQSRSQGRGIVATIMGCDGSKADLISMPGGGSRNPATLETVKAKLHCMHMKGREVFKDAIQTLTGVAQQVLNRANLSVSDIACIVPHQANRRIIEAVGQRLGAKSSQVFMNLQSYGNTSSASIPLALSEAAASGRIKRGDLLLLLSFGAGLTWAATVLEW